MFVTDYPKEIKAFYMRMNDDGKTVAAADLLVPGVGELCGGSQREERLDVLTARIEELHMKPEDYWWYLELRKYGTCKHAGFGMGLRAPHHVPDRHRQHPRRAALPAHHAQLRFLKKGKTKRPSVTGGRFRRFVGAFSVQTPRGWAAAKSSMAFSKPSSARSCT